MASKKVSDQEGVAVASNYEEICEENRESYGTKGAQKSGKLAAGLYDDRTHFSSSNCCKTPRTRSVGAASGTDHARLRSP